MKVASTSGTDPIRAAVTFVAVALAVAIGANLVPTPRAAAAVSGPELGNVGHKVLEPVEEPQKADEIRQPSGLAEVDEVGVCALTPTKVRPRRAYVPGAVSAPSTASTAPTDGWQRARVSWYGPGFYGHTMAGGGTLQPDSMVVAHRSMAFGTRIEFSYNGRTCVAVVMDRGPYTGGRTFDLGPGTASALGFSGVGTVEYRIVN